MPGLPGGSRAAHIPSLRENLGSLWLHLKLIGGPAWPLSSKLSRADAEGIGLQSLCEMQGCIWPAGGSTAPLQFLAHPWWHAQSCLLSRQEEPEVWFILTITEVLRILVTIDEALASHIFLHVIILSICFPEENGQSVKVIRPKSFSNSWPLNCPSLGSPHPGELIPRPRL